MGLDVKKQHLWISEADRRRLELIRDVFGVSLSGAMRVALRAACEKLGIERPTSDDFLKKK